LDGPGDADTSKWKVNGAIKPVTASPIQFHNLQVRNWMGDAEAGGRFYSYYKNQVLHL
jgi:hypothetical protein